MPEDKGKQPHPRIPEITNDQYFAIKCAAFGTYIVKYGKAEPFRARVVVETLIKELDLGMTPEEFLTNIIECEASLVESLEEALTSALFDVFRKP